MKQVELAGGLCWEASEPFRHFVLAGRLDLSAFSGVKPWFNCLPKGLQKRLPESLYSVEYIDVPRGISRLLTLY